MTIAKWRQDGAEHRGLPTTGSEGEYPELWTLKYLADCSDLREAVNDFTHLSMPMLLLNYPFASERADTKDRGGFQMKSSVSCTNENDSRALFRHEAAFVTTH